MPITQSSIASNVISGATGPVGPTGATGITGATGSAPWVTSGSDIYYNSGNVGIGTTSPQAKLQVTTSSFPVLKIADNVGGGALALGDSGITSNYVGVWRGAGNSIGGGGFLNVQGNGIAFMSSDNVFGSGSERMRILSNGNVGIGTNNPGQTLDVVGTVRGTTGLISGPYRTVSLNGNFTSGTFYEIANQENIPRGTWIVNAYVDTYAAGGGIYFVTYSSVPFFIMDTSSNSSDISVLPTMLGSGHAPNGNTGPILRIRLSPSASSDAGKIFVEMNPNANWTGINGTSGRNVIFYLKRLTE